MGVSDLGEYVPDARHSKPWLRPCAPWRSPTLLICLSPTIFMLNSFYQLYCTRYKWHNLIQISALCHILQELPSSPNSEMPGWKRWACELPTWEHILFTHHPPWGQVQCWPNCVSLLNHLASFMPWHLLWLLWERWVIWNTEKYVTRHTAAVTIQRTWCGFQIRKRLKQVGFSLCISSQEVAVHERYCQQSAALFLQWKSN